MTPKRERDPEHAPGERYLIEARDCDECGKPLLSEGSKARGCGPRCAEKRGGGAREYARLEAQGQLRMPWEAGV